jgi:RHS repeat-associated protein
LPIPQVIMETNEANTVQTTYTYGNDLISTRGVYNRYSNHYFYYDGIGSVRQMAGNMTASVFDNATYDAFGNRIALEGYNLCAYGFTGEQQFDETENVVYLRARYYDTNVGRFISRDPIGIRGGLNLYAYVKNNPINHTDPFGLAPFYGRYCGSGRLGGMPIDELDSACKDHDDCYVNCNGSLGICGVIIPSSCRRKCDADLCVNAYSARCTTWQCEVARAIVMGICGRAIFP